MRTFAISEADAIDRTGLSQYQLEALTEHLREGYDYVQPGRRIYYSEEGLITIAKKFAARQEEEAKIESSIPAAVEIHTEKLIIHRTAQHGLMNRNIVEAWLHQDGKNVRIVRVRVRDNSQYNRGQTIAGRVIGDDLFEAWDTTQNRPSVGPKNRGKN